MDSGFWILGGSGPPGPSLAGGAEPTVSDTVGEREGTWWWKQEEKDKEVKPIFFHAGILCARLRYLCPVVRLWRPV